MSNIAVCDLFGVLFHFGNDIFNWFLYSCFWNDFTSLRRLY